VAAAVALLVQEPPAGHLLLLVGNRLLLPLLASTVEADQAESSRSSQHTAPRMAVVVAAALRRPQRTLSEDRQFAEGAAAVVAAALPLATPYRRRWPVDCQGHMSEAGEERQDRQLLRLAGALERTAQVSLPGAVVVAVGRHRQPATEQLVATVVQLVAAAVAVVPRLRLERLLEGLEGLVAGEK
jgi:hypothetical protein